MDYRIEKLIAEKKEELETEEQKAAFEALSRMAVLKAEMEVLKRFGFAFSSLPSECFVEEFHKAIQVLQEAIRGE